MTEVEALRKVVTAMKSWVEEQFQMKEQFFSLYECYQYQIEANFYGEHEFLYDMTWGEFIADSVFNPIDDFLGTPRFRSIEGGYVVYDTDWYSVKIYGASSMSLDDECYPVEMHEVKVTDRIEYPYYYFTDKEEDWVS